MENVDLQRSPSDHGHIGLWGLCIITILIIKVKTCIIVWELSALSLVVPWWFNFEPGFSLVEVLQSFVVKFLWVHQSHKVVRQYHFYMHFEQKQMHRPEAVHKLKNWKCETIFFDALFLRNLFVDLMILFFLHQVVGETCEARRRLQTRLNFWPQEEDKTRVTQSRSTKGLLKKKQAHFRFDAW